MKKTFLDAAIRKCGGNEEKGRLLYTAYGSAGQVSVNIIHSILYTALFSVFVGAVDIGF